MESNQMTVSQRMSPHERVTIAIILSKFRKPFLQQYLSNGLSVNLPCSRGMRGDFFQLPNFVTCFKELKSTVYQELH